MRIGTKCKTVLQIMLYSGMKTKIICFTVSIYIVSKFIKKLNLSNNKTYIVHKEKTACKKLYGTSSMVIEGTSTLSFFKSY